MGEGKLGIFGWGNDSYANGFRYTLGRWVFVVDVTRWGGTKGEGGRGSSYTTGTLLNMQDTLGNA